MKYYISNATEDEPLETMAMVTGTRYRVEEYFEEGKGYLGMAQYEARAWVAIVEYHLQRNRIALKSHTKSWRRRTKVRYKVLL